MKQTMVLGFIFNFFFLRRDLMQLRLLLTLAETAHELIMILLLPLPRCWGYGEYWCVISCLSWFVCFVGFFEIFVFCLFWFCVDQAGLELVDISLPLDPSAKRHHSWLIAKFLMTFWVLVIDFVEILSFWLFW